MVSQMHIAPFDIEIFDEKTYFEIIDMMIFLHSE